MADEIHALLDLLRRGDSDGTGEAQRQDVIDRLEAAKRALDATTRPEGEIS